MLADIRPRRQNAPRPAWKAAESFKGWLRKRRCACNGMNPHCGGKIEAAHVDYAGKGTRDAKGMRSKVADRFCIPLSTLCHKLQTDKGWPWFEKNILKRRAVDIAEYLWGRWPGRIAWEAKQ